MPKLTESVEAWMLEKIDRVVMIRVQFVKGIRKPSRSMYRK